MGIFSGIKKVFKGVGKIFKKIGKGIKKAFKGIGKFMGKIGIIGQIGLSLLLPGIGTMLGGLAGSMIATGGSALVKGAGHFLKAAVTVGSKIGGMVKTVTQGVTNVIGNVAGSVLNKIPGADSLVKSVTGLDINNASFGNAVKAAQSTVTDFATQGRDLFSMDTLTSDKFITSGTKAQIEAAKSGVPSTEEVLETSGKMPAPSADMEAYMEAGRPASTITADDIYTRGSASLTAGPDTMIPLDTPRSLLGSTVNSLKPSVDPTVSLNIQAPDLDALSGQVKPTFGEKLAAVPGKLKEDAIEYVQGKVETLQDPYKLAKAGFETYQASRQEDQMLAAQQAAMSGDVINVGQYQDPSAFLAYQTQNTVAPIQGFQAPALYDAPLSSWGQQFMFDPFAQQPMRTA
jgi:hypothetical protein